MQEERRGDIRLTDMFMGIVAAAYWLWCEPNITPPMMVLTGLFVVLVMALAKYILLPLLATVWRSWRRT